MAARDCFALYKVTTKKKDKHKKKYDHEKQTKKNSKKNVALIVALKQIKPVNSSFICLQNVVRNIFL